MQLQLSESKYKIKKWFDVFLIFSLSSFGEFDWCYQKTTKMFDIENPVTLSRKNISKDDNQ